MTVAVTCCVVLMTTLAVGDETDTVMAGTVITIEAVFVESAAAIAVSNTSRSLAGGLGGAEYVVAPPLAVVLGETLPQDAAEHETAHVTP